MLIGGTLKIETIKKLRKVWLKTKRSLWFQFIVNVVSGVLASFLAYLLFKL